MSRELLRRSALLSALALTAPLAACSGNAGGAAGDDGDITVQVLAAASLTDVFTQLGEDFEARSGVDVELSFGSSTDLAEQAADGAPGDVLATADAVSMGLAEESGVVEQPQTFAANVLVIVTPAGNPASIGSPADLAGSTWVRCADEVPCGRVARAVLADAGVDAEPVSLEQDVRATLDKVTSGEADAGLVYATDATAAGDAVTAVSIEGAEEHQATYRIGALQQASDPDAAQDFVDLVTGPEGQDALRAAGFTLP
jgi:molybdate transport system substrate-binding protein